jgi:S1-C subfamily serine protease
VSSAGARVKILRVKLDAGRVTVVLPRTHTPTRSGVERSGKATSATLLSLLSLLLMHCGGGAPSVRPPTGTLSQSDCVQERQALLQLRRDLESVGTGRNKGPSGVLGSLIFAERVTLETMSRLPSEGTAKASLGAQASRFRADAQTLRSRERGFRNAEERLAFSRTRLERSCETDASDECVQIRSILADRLRGRETGGGRARGVSAEKSEAPMRPDRQRAFRELLAANTELAALMDLASTLDVKDESGWYGEALAETKLCSAGTESFPVELPPASRVLDDKALLTIRRAVVEVEAVPTDACLQAASILVERPSERWGRNESRSEGRGSEGSAPLRSALSGFGSGFLLAPDASTKEQPGTSASVSSTLRPDTRLVVTSLHVVDSAAEIRIRDDEHKLLGSARIVYAAPNADVVVLAVNLTEEERGRDGLRFASEGVRDLQQVVAAGFPALAGEASFQITRGHVSNAKTRADLMPGKVSLVQFTAPVDAGSSGGPLLDERGLVLGVTILKAQNREAVAFAAPAVFARRAVLRSQLPRPTLPSPQEGCLFVADALERGDVEGVASARLRAHLDGANKTKRAELLSRASEAPQVCEVMRDAAIARVRDIFTKIGGFSNLDACSNARWTTDSNALASGGAESGRMQSASDVSSSARYGSASLARVDLRGKNGLGLTLTIAPAVIPPGEPGEAFSPWELVDAELNQAVR